jgi:hypothetical protein
MLTKIDPNIRHSVIEEEMINYSSSYFYFYFSKRSGPRLR